MLLLLAFSAAPTEYPVLELKTGEVRVIHCVDIARIAVGDPKVVDTKRLSRSEMEITAVKAGRTTVLIWHSSGDRQSWEVTVREPSAPSKKEQAQAPLPRGAP